MTLTWYDHFFPIFKHHSLLVQFLNVVDTWIVLFGIYFLTKNHEIDYITAKYFYKNLLMQYGHHVLVNNF